MKKITLVIACMALIFAGCKKDKDEPTPAPVTPPALNANSTPQVSFKMDGTSYLYKEGTLYSSGVGSSHNISSTGDSSSVAYGSSMDDDASGDVIFSIDLGFLKYMGMLPTKTQFDNLFKTGSYNYVMDTQYNKGVGAYFVSGTNFYSTVGIFNSNQTGSAFNIVDVKPWTILGADGVNVMINFNCKFYDMFGGVHTVTEGVYIGAFENM